MPTATSTAAVVTKTSGSLGVPLPDGLVASLQAAETLVVAAEDLRRDVTRLHNLTLDCLAQNRDPAGDKLVLAELARHQLANAGVGQAGHDRAETMIGAALIQHSPAIIGGWSQALQPHLDMLTAAADSRLVENLDDFSNSRSEPAVKHWRNSVEAVRLTGIAQTGVLAIALAANATPTRDTMPLLYTPATADQLDAVIADTGARPTVWLAAKHGLRLAMVDSLDELRSRIADYQADRAAAHDAWQRQQNHPQRPAFQTYA